MAKHVYQITYTCIPGYSHYLDTWYWILISRFSISFFHRYIASDHPMLRILCWNGCRDLCTRWNDSQQYPYYERTNFVNFVIRLAILFIVLRIIHLYFFKIHFCLGRRVCVAIIAFCVVFFLPSFLFPSQPSSIDLPSSVKFIAGIPQPIRSPSRSTKVQSLYVTSSSIRDLFHSCNMPIS